LDNYRITTPPFQVIANPTRRDIHIRLIFPILIPGFHNSERCSRVYYVVNPLTTPIIATIVINTTAITSAAAPRTQRLEVIQNPALTFVAVHPVSILLRPRVFMAAKQATNRMKRPAMENHMPKGANMSPTPMGMLQKRATLCQARDGQGNMPGTSARGGGCGGGGGGGGGS